ncbi:MAG: DUF4097 family beta strand repeat-containing protein [Solibacillus sp.]
MEKRYLEILENKLYQLNERERRDIIRDFQEYFENGRSEGKSTDEIINALGSAEQIAEELLTAYSPDDFKQPAKISHTLTSTVPYNKINIKATNARIILKSAPIDQAKIEVKSDDDLSETAMNIEGDTLFIKIKRKQTQRRILFFINISYDSEAQVIIYVPEQQYELLKVVNDNGSIIASNLRVHETDIETDNGRIEINDINGDTFKARTDNGKIVLSNGEMEFVEAFTDNGRIVIEDMKAQHFKLKTDSGRIELMDVQGAIKAKTDYGSIKGKFAKVENPLSLKSDFGSVSLSTKDKIQNATIKCKSDAGSVKIYTQSTKHYVDGAGELSIGLKTDYGRIVVDTNYKE